MGRPHPVFQSALLTTALLGSGCQVQLSCDTEPEGAKLHQQGVELMVQGKPGQAAEVFERVIALAPEEPQPRISYCQALAQAEQPERALRACQRAADMVPGDAEVRYMLASLHLFADRPDQARTAIVQAIGLDPTEAKHHALLGVIDLQVRNVPAAIGHLQEAVRLDPADRSPQRNLAIALGLCGRCQAAARVAKAARDLGDDGQAIAGAIEKNCRAMLPGRTDAGAFLIDRRAVGGRAYSACVDEGACPEVPYGEFNRQAEYADQPAMSIGFEAARAYCEHVGKRLPTVAEVRATADDLEWRGCCARGVIPREWTADAGKRKNTFLQVRKARRGFQVKPARKTRRVDASTVRCAKDLAAGCLTD